MRWLRRLCWSRELERKYVSFCLWGMYLNWAQRKPCEILKKSVPISYYGNLCVFTELIYFLLSCGWRNSNAVECLCLFVYLLRFSWISDIKKSHIWTVKMLISQREGSVTCKIPALNSRSTREACCLCRCQGLYRQFTETSSGVEEIPMQWRG